MHGAVAAGHQVTAQAGADVLAAGGNAIDAAVAAGVMSWVSEPALTGPCGGGFLVIHPGGGASATVLDAFTAIPGRELPRSRKLTDVDSVEVPFGRHATQVFHIGAASCAVPGVVAGLHAAHRRFGRLPWRELLAPAAGAARAGVRILPNQYEVFLAIKAVLLHTPESSEIFAPGGRFVRRGEYVRQPELAVTIERLAEEGPGVLFRGELARAMVDHQHETGGRLTLADLAAYRPIWRRPLAVDYHGHRLLTNPPPSSGGALVAYFLAVLERLGEPLPHGEARTLRLVAETMRAAGRMRDARFERLLHGGGLVRHLLSERSLARGVRAVHEALESVPSPALAVPADPGTTHISVVDGEGTAVAFTASNGCHSGVVVPGTGLHLNNMMGEEDLAAGRDAEPGGRLTSMQSPSIVLDAAGDVRLVLGSSGSNRLRSAIVQVVVNTLENGMSAQEATDAPRVHVEGDRLDCEGGFDVRELDRLASWGEKLVRFDSLNLYFGGANIVRVDPDGGLEAAGDPRRDGGGVVLR